MQALLGSDGVLPMQTMPDVAPRISDDEAGLERYRNRALQMLCVAGLAGLAGLTQLSLPWATRSEAPLGLSLVGPPGSDRSLVALAQRIAI
jgi:amidase